MTDSIYTLLSALLGLVLLNSTILVSARNYRTGWIGGLPVEVRYVALFSLILLVALNGNQWMSGNVLFPLLIIAAIAVVVVSARKLNESDRREALKDGISLLAVQALTLLVVFMAFQMHRYWILDAHNHDSVIYYQGMLWAIESPLFVANEATLARWGLTGYIGFDLPLYRGGTYTLAAWVQYFAPRVTGNGLYFIAAYATTMAWFAVRLLSTSVTRFSAALASGLLALAVALSTGLIGALVNSNLATVLGGASLMLIVALAFRTDLQCKVRYGLMAAWCAVCAHVYAESVFYAGLLICLVFVLELRTNIRFLKLAGVSRLAILLLLIVLGLGNIAVGQAFSSLFLFGEVAKGGEWFAWYLHQSPTLWVGSFVAGLLMNSVVSIPKVALAAVVTLSAAVFLIYSRETRSGTLALIGLSLLAVIYVELTGYQYGEHKIVHLLGPAWALLMAATISRLLGRADDAVASKQSAFVGKIVGGSLLICLAFIVASFSASAVSLLNQLRGPHGLDFGLTALASHIRPGETVLVDDSAWIGVEKFQKGHYLTFQLHNQGAKVLMPSITSDKLRGGYFRDSRNNTFNSADKVDWLVQSRGYAIGNSKFVLTSGTPIWENADYRLYHVGKNPAIVSSNGWYDCESTHCWTMAPFEIETYVPSNGHFELSIDFLVFRPPENGKITVRTSDGRLLATTNASTKQLRIQLPEGWSRLVFDSDWSISSPKEMGMSDDSRKLLAAIQHLEIIPLQMGEVE